MKFIQLIKYQINVTNSLIYLTFQKTKSMPTISHAIESEFVNGTLSYTGENPEKFKFAKDGGGDRYYLPSLFKYFTEQLKKESYILK